MISGPAPLSSPSLSNTTSAANFIPPSRTGRFRGLSYLRNYTGALPDQRLSAAETPNTTPEPTHRQQTWPRRRRHQISDSEGSYPQNSALSSGEDVLPVATPSRGVSNLSRRSGASEATIGGWLPTVACLARPTTQLYPASGNPDLSAIVPSPQLRHRIEGEMALHRSATSPVTTVSFPQPLSVSRTHPVQSSSSRNRQSGARGSETNVATMNPSAGESSNPNLPISQLPSIRFVPYNDPRSSRPSLAFPTITRTLPNSSSTIKVGRYSEKDSSPQDLTNNLVSDAPVGFKSKVVSRRHCEFFYMDNQWHVRDVKSSSGTFLNHIRLSPPGEESKPFAVKDGDLVQLGIDFKGGEEMIFRCVKIRILCNRGWQKSVNKFNKYAHKQLNDLHRGKNKEFKESTECTICLNSIAPCQSLFVAPCSHTWHYKCIRPMLEEARSSSSAFAHFLCPNCRSITDLDADVEEVPHWEDDLSDEELEALQSQAGLAATSGVEDGLDSPREDALNADLDSLALHDNFQHPSFGLPPANNTISRSGSIRALNPSASSFVPTSSSALPLHPTPSLTADDSANIPEALPSLGLKSSITIPRSSTPNSVRLRQPAYPPPLSSRLSTVLQSHRHAPPYEDETISSPESEHGVAEDPSYAARDERTISPASSSQYASLDQEQRHFLSLNTRQQSNGDINDEEGPMTPRNNAGPFVLDGTAGDASANAPDATYLISLDQAARLS